MKAASLILALLFALTLVGCTFEEQSTLIGVPVGTVTGTIVGHESGHAEEGVLIGGTAGPIGGSLYGKQRTRQNPDGTVQNIVTCPHCNTDLGLPADTTEGMMLQCSNCGKEFKLTKSQGEGALTVGTPGVSGVSSSGQPTTKPADTTLQNIVTCPHCGINLQLPANATAGVTLQCPSCGKQFQLTGSQ